MEVKIKSPWSPINNDQFTQQNPFSYDCATYQFFLFSFFLYSCCFLCTTNDLTKDQSYNPSAQLPALFGISLLVCYQLLNL
jgi:hypothetical protein